MPACGGLKSTRLCALTRVVTTESPVTRQVLSLRRERLVVLPGCVSTRPWINDALAAMSAVAVDVAPMLMAALPPVMEEPVRDTMAGPSVRWMASAWAEMMSESTSVNVFAAAPVDPVRCSPCALAPAVCSVAPVALKRVALTDTRTASASAPCDVIWLPVSPSRPRLTVPQPSTWMPYAACPSVLT
ncbi:hypothetical protein D3C86_1403020 [compost metagenome]